ncbi:MAG: hypothetical protein DWQ01_09740 [Planctomycetota bacterium]|nr:MAG: hypothetical protein DWQ01_09740 [Planctomycetota bacterium]
MSRGLKVNGTQNQGEDFSMMMPQVRVLIRKRFFFSFAWSWKLVWAVPLMVVSCAFQPDVRYEVEAKFPDRIAEIIGSRDFSPEDQAAVREALVFSHLIEAYPDEWSRRAMLNLKRTRVFLSVDDGEPKELALELLREAGKQVMISDGTWNPNRRNEYWILLGNFELVAPGVWRVDWVCSGTIGGWLQITLKGNTWTDIKRGGIWLS